MQFHLNGFKPGNYQVPDAARKPYPAPPIAPLPGEVDVLIVGTGPAGLTMARQMSEFADITYWVFESETPEGLFGSAESIEAMKEAFDIFLDDEGYEEYCLLDYSDDDGASPECRTPLSPLTMYYASSWDSEKVASVMKFNAYCGAQKL